MKTRMKILTAFAAAGVVLGSAGIAQAQRSPEYAAARKAGTVGERPDGYLGIVGSATPELRKLVNDINIQRRAVYTQAAQAQNTTLEQAAFVGGCKAIQRTSPGEKYMTPSGQWTTRGSGAPQLDSSCPN
ncbi:YdbL family protein [Stakelama marina]|uniref:YdbL family protein n=1 Tax=Stakelama marina TaxID=2826939 RepID=A0A8T4IIF0_9SPHN|nr:YdbL family protein [Stakelama marina]MBR0553664.1 YdbL family protein [Stakelama marina]